MNQEYEVGANLSESGPGFLAQFKKEEGKGLAEADQEQSDLQSRTKIEEMYDRSILPIVDLLRSKGLRKREIAHVLSLNLKSGSNYDGMAVETVENLDKLRLVVIGDYSKRKKDNFRTQDGVEEFAERIGVLENYVSEKYS